MRSTRAPRVFRPLALALALLLAAGSRGGTPGRAEVADPPTRRDRREIHDAVGLLLAAEEGKIRGEVKMARPLLDGVFTCVHLYFDCDDRRDTGLEGMDLWTRFAVGSRYRPTAAPPRREGMRAPFDLRTSGWSRLPRAEERSGGAPPVWIHSGTLAPPAVDGDRLSFEIPLRLLAEQGLRYNEMVSFRVEVESGCSESPLGLDYVADGEGFTARLDGEEGDWLGAEEAADPPDELHPDTAESELTGLAAAHDDASVQLLVRFQRGGFGLPGSGEDDVVDEDQLHVGVEPSGESRYMKYAQFTIHTTTPLSRPAGAGSPSWATLGGRVVEIRVPRPTEQTRFRLFVWSDAIRRDRVPDSGLLRLEIPAAAWGRR